MIEFYCSFINMGRLHTTHMPVLVVFVIRIGRRKSHGVAGLQLLSFRFCASAKRGIEFYEIIGFDDTPIGRCLNNWVFEN